MKNSKKNKVLKKLIGKMTEIDQVARKLSLKNADNRLYNFLVYVIDGVHNFRIKEIIKRYGYPTSSLLGVQHMKKFWLLIQHQDFDLNLQKECLEKCDFAPKEHAYLLDRVLVNEGKKQMYGTQFSKKKYGKIVFRPMHDFKNVDKRRKKVGLMSIKKYLKQAEALYKKKV